MKKRLYIFAIGIVAGVMFAGCTREEAPSGSETTEVEELVTVSLSYKDISAKEVTVTKATSAENQLNNLQVFIFDVNGRLKGYKYLGFSELVQDGSQGEVTVKTSTGTSYIYGVANVPTTAYKLSRFSDESSQPLPTSDPTTVSSGKWADWNEDNAQMKQIDFTLSDLKKIPFYRTAAQLSITESSFMMSGATDNGGSSCTISKDGSISGDGLIKLRRIVSKVTFNVKSGSQYGKTISFTPSSYDICNVPIEGSLIKDGGVSASTFEDFTGRSFSAQDAGTVSFYLPENIQTTTAEISDVHAREADKVELDTDGKKVFTNAPDNGTYIVLHGTYSEKSSDGTLLNTGNTRYYIHLGNFNTSSGGSLSEFSVNRNYIYEYNVTVNGVNDIETQVTTSQDGETYNDLEPGAEGLVLNYNGGKMFTLDAHYDYCVMKFKKVSIQALKNDANLKDNGVNGYSFRVAGLTDKGEYAESKTITITDKEFDSSDLNGVGINWVRFLKGGTYVSSSTDDNIERHGGSDAGYKELREANGYTSGEIGVGLTVVELLQHLYDIADDSDKWDSDGTLTYTCYVDENYYEKLPWADFVNKDSRVLYIADEVQESKDGRSLYATVAYSLFQHSIKTFYNTEYGDGGSDDIVAYGLETIRDDGKVSPTDKTLSGGSDRWDGLANMKKDVKVDGNWSGIKYEQFRQACMSRNRDLDGDGLIDRDEMRWYCPAIDQYAGMWIGENAISDVDARLFTNSTKDLSEPNGDYLNRSGAEHYFSNTSSLPVFWAEEGMATGNKTNSTALKYVKCIRNLKSNGSAVGDSETDCPSADKYYDYSNKVVDLSKISSSALRTTVQTTELSPHAERGSEYLELSNASVKFKVASSLAKKYRKETKQEWYQATCGETGEHMHYNSDGTPLWKVIYTKKPCTSTTYKARTVTYYQAEQTNWSGNMKDLAEDDITPCNAAYSEENGSSDKGTWRAPNQRELCMMKIVGTLTNNEASRTHFSGYTNFRYGWTNYGSDIIMSNSSDSYYKNRNVRCVKDVEQ